MTASIGGRRGRAYAPSARRSSASSLFARRPVAGTCRVVFEVARTRVPGGGDTRELGAHFNRFVYRP